MSIPYVVMGLALLMGVEGGVEGVMVIVDGDPARAADPRDSTTRRSSEWMSTYPSGDSRRGEELYNASCMVCHGPRGTGKIGPRLTGGSVLSNEQAFWKTVHEGRHAMPPLKGVLTDQQIADILAWLKTLP